MCYVTHTKVVFSFQQRNIASQYNGLGNSPSIQELQLTSSLSQKSLHWFCDSLGVYQGFPLSPTCEWWSASERVWCGSIKKVSLPWSLISCSQGLSLSLSPLPHINRYIKVILKLNRIYYFIERLALRGAVIIMIYELKSCYHWSLLHTYMHT